MTEEQCPICLQKAIARISLQGFLPGSLPAYTQIMQRTSLRDALAGPSVRHKAAAITKRATVPRSCITLRTYVRRLFKLPNTFHQREYHGLQARARGRQRSGTSLTSHGPARPRRRCRSAAATSRCPRPAG